MADPDPGSDQVFVNFQNLKIQKKIFFIFSKIFGLKLEKIEKIETINFCLKILFKESFILFLFLIYFSLAGSRWSSAPAQVQS